MKTDTDLETGLANDEREMRIKAERVLFDNENYENVATRVYDENMVAKNRLAECRAMLKRYEESCKKWEHIHLECTIVKEDYESRSHHL